MTFSELETALNALLDTDTGRYPSVTAQLHINQAVRSLSNACEAPFDEATGTFNSVIGTANYDLDSVITSTITIDRPLGVYWDTAAAGTELVPCTREQYREWYPLGATANATPVHWAWFDNKLWLGPPPSAVKALTVDFKGMPDDMSGAGESNGWTIRATYAVLYKAAAIASAWLLEDERAATFLGLVDREVQSLEAMWSKHRPRGGKDAGTTLASLRFALGDLLGATVMQYPLAVRQTHLNQAVRSLSASVDAPWDQATGTFNTVDNDPDYVLNTTFSAASPNCDRPFAVYLTADGSELTPVTREQYRQRYRIGITKGTPVAWTWYGGQLFLGPPPSGVIGITVDYRSIPDDMALDSDSNGWTINANHCVLYRAAAYGAQYLNQPDMAQAFLGQLDRELAALRVLWEKYQIRGGGSVATTAVGLKRSLGDLVGVDVAACPMELRLYYLNNAISELARRCEAPWDEITDSFALVVGTSSYDLSTQFGATAPLLSLPLMLSYVNSSGEEIALGQLKIHEFKDTWPDGSDNGAPEHFCLFGDDTVMIGPPPDDTYTLSVLYRGRPIDLAADADHNGWTDNASDLVLLVAAANLCRHLRDPREAQFRASAEERLATYVTEWSQRHRSARHYIQTIETGGGW